MTRIEHDRKTATVQPISRPDPARSPYDHVVVAPGSVSRTLPIPGLREHGIGFKTIGEAIYLRNHVLDRLDVAAATTDPDVRRRALTFVFVGGGYAGIEALAEMEDMARDALRYYPELQPEDMRWVLVEATERILPEVDRDMGAYTVQQLLQAEHGHPAGHPAGVLRRRGGRSSPTATASAADTIVWTAGVKPSPMLDATDLPRDERRPGHLPADPAGRRTATGSSRAPGAPVTAPRCRT